MTEGTASDRGALSELVVMVDLMRRGYQVYRAVSPAAGCDLLIVWGNTVRRVEVKTAKRCKSGGLKFDHGSLHPTRYDVLALAVHGGEVVYRPALEEPH